MYIVNGICYAGIPCSDAHSIRIVEAQALTGGILLVHFLNGEKRLFDTTTLTGSAFDPLKDESVFRDFKIEHGFISWAHGAIDIAPEYVYEHSCRYDENGDSI